MQGMQNVCPQGRVVGSEKVSWQTAHLSVSRRKSFIFLELGVMVSIEF